MARHPNSRRRMAHTSTKSDRRRKGEYQQEAERDKPAKYKRYVTDTAEWAALAAADKAKWAAIGQAEQGAGWINAGRDANEIAEQARLEAARRLNEVGSGGGGGGASTMADTVSSELEETKRALAYWTRMLMASRIGSHAEYTARKGIRLLWAQEVVRLIETEHETGENGRGDEQ